MSLYKEELEVLYREYIDLVQELFKTYLPAPLSQAEKTFSMYLHDSTIALKERLRGHEPAFLQDELIKPTDQ